MASAALVWERWFHASVLGLESETAPSWLRTFRYVPPLWLLAMAAVLVGTTLAYRLDVTTRVRTVWHASAISVCFGSLLAVAIAIHDVLLSPRSVSAAPGASYLTDDTGIVGALLHGLGDAVIAQLILLPIAGVWAFYVRETSTVAGPVESSPASATEARREAVTGRRIETSAPATLSRREALQFGAAGSVAVAIGSGGLVALTAEEAHAVAPAEVTPWLSRGIKLYINEGIKQMIDRTPVYMWGWGFESEGVDDRDGLNTPGPVIWTHEGETVELEITNTLNEDHSFVIDGVVDSGVIAPGTTVELSFDAPSAGTYLYQDRINHPVNRVLGLHGVLLVMPADRSMRFHSALDLQYWEFDSQWVWVLNEIDPKFNAKAQADVPIDPDRFVADFLPRYFTINGRMGSLAAHVETAPDTVIIDQLGNPALIRMVNAGIAIHCPHMHGNHVYPLSTNNELANPIMWKDQVMMKPGVTRDVFLPFNIPPNAVYWPPHPDGAAFLKELHGHDMEGTFPMHCHVEQSQTAGGGLYPQGLLTDWKIK